MQRCRISLLALFAVAALTVIVTGITPACASESQLAGIRLGQHALNVFQVYGQPDTVVLGSEGPGSITSYSGGGGAAAGGMGAGPGGAGGPGGPGGAPGGGPEGFGAAAAAAAGGGGASGLGGLIGGLLGGGMGGGMPGGGGPGGPGAMGGMAGPGGAGGPGGGPGAGGGPGGGAGAGGGGPQATRFAQARQLPDWASPATVEVQAKETMWLYRRGDVVLNFILDRDGYVVAIAVGGKKCDWIRTALNEPGRAIKLGDSFKKVVDRYGYPEETTVEPGEGFSQDTTLHYGYGQNITFTLRDMKVRRIYIWEVELRPEAPVRLPAAGLGTTPRPGVSRTGLPPVQRAPSGFRR